MKRSSCDCEWNNKKKLKVSDPMDEMNHLTGNNGGQQDSPSKNVLPKVHTWNDPMKPLGGGIKSDDENQEKMPKNIASRVRYADDNMRPSTSAQHQTIPETNDSQDRNFTRIPRFRARRLRLRIRRQTGAFRRLGRIPREDVCAIVPCTFGDSFVLVAFFSGFAKVTTYTFI